LYLRLYLTQIKFCRHKTAETDLKNQLQESVQTAPSQSSVSVAIQTPSKLLRSLVEGAGAVALSKKAMEKEFKQFAEKVIYIFLFFHPVRWFYFILHIAIRITNCNSSTSDVGGSLLPCLSEYSLLVRLLVPSTTRSSFIHLYLDIFNRI
jgi:hypothetical protein